MHEMRSTPSPMPDAVVSERKVSFQWPMQAEMNVQSPLDGYVKVPKTDKTRLRYRVAYARDSLFTTEVTQAETRWPFYNPDTNPAPGVWYWRYGYVHNGQTQWSSPVRFTIADQPETFCPPPFRKIVTGLPQGHPRIWVSGSEHPDAFRRQTRDKAERRWYVHKADKVLKTPMLSVTDINTAQVKKLANAVQVKAYLTRESRRVIDKEESNCRALTGAYLLTGDARYAQEATRRVLQMIDWSGNANVKGDFNAATLLSLSTMAYDSFYDILTDSQRQTLRQAIAERAGAMYAQYNNHLENHIADNHVWQMTLRILTMAAFAVYGEVPEATLWADYCYNVWVARFPGLNADGGWHNGDSYFTVNTKTLIEVPWFYSRLSGYDFFSDPWYRRNVLYTIYNQPPFSKSAGNGSSHLGKQTPSAPRVGYLDALARLTGDTYAADFVRRTLAERPDYLRKGFINKPGDLSWFRLQCDRPLPQGKGLAALPAGQAFPATGLADFVTDWEHPRRSAMWSFRSSPYGSTSHALANQNAFNTFFGGQPLFYSSGHHTSFIDRHSIYAHRGTRAHNTILPNGMGQRIGTEGYGWIPRHYVGRNVGYVLGDASNAYGRVISPLWLSRGRLADVAFTPETGWDKNHVNTYRRHIVDLGATGLVFIYDELEGDTAVAWNYLLHSVLQPLNMDRQPGCTRISTRNDHGLSDAYLYAAVPLQTDTTDRFFYPAHNWLKGDADGKFRKYENHWHFTAVTPAVRVCRLATIIDTRALRTPARTPVRVVTTEAAHGGWTVEVDGWRIEANLTAKGKPMFRVENRERSVCVHYTGGATGIIENDTTTSLSDRLPELEI